MEKYPKTADNVMLNKKKFLESTIIKVFFKDLPYIAVYVETAINVEGDQRTFFSPFQ